MSDVVVRIENLSKEYRLGILNYGTLSQDLQSYWAKLRGKEDPNSEITLSASEQSEYTDEKFLALHDVSFDVKQGEIVGIIGPNGAGKSTLLKIISRVTAPTRGTVKIKGTVSSLLEVGTGFHPELPGRENVYLNGAILGMSKKEIDAKFDEIVAFAGVEKFIDTPVKRYSSGMLVRLAFAVAAHLEPEIMVVDEVLAVGDAKFQAKCLRKMDSVAKSEGRTVLFVSHNMAAVRQLCPRTILLDRGRIIADGPSIEITREYEILGSSTSGAVDNGIFIRNQQDIRYKPAWIAKVGLYNAHSEPCMLFDYGSTMKIRIEIGGEPPADDFTVEWALFNEKGELVSYGGSFSLGKKVYPRKQRVVTCELGPLPLTMGKYTLSFGIRIWNQAHWDWWGHGASFRVVECDPSSSGFSMNANNWGSVYINQKWC